VERLFNREPFRITAYGYQCRCGSLDVERGDTSLICKRCNNQGDQL
jgi:hypothetical protein